MTAMTECSRENIKIIKSSQEIAVGAVVLHGYKDTYW